MKRCERSRQPPGRDVTDLSADSEVTEPKRTAAQRQGIQMFWAGGNEEKIMSDTTVRWRALGLSCCAAMLAIAGTTAMAQVKAPPLPAGSAQVTVEPGENPVETKRNVRAHSNKRWAGKDPTRDDRRDPKPGKGKNR